MQPEVSIIIPAFNQAGYTRGCLAAVRENTAPGYEVIVVDNGSSDDTPSLLTELVGGEFPLRVITFRENRGYSAANNAAAQVATGEYLVLLNNDTLPQAGWLTALLYTARRRQVGVVGSKLVYPKDDTIQHAGYVYSDRGIFYPLYQGFAQDDPLVNREREFVAVLGACQLIRRELFLEVGGLEEYALEDVDLCMKVRERGYRVLYCPSSFVYHFGSVTLFGADAPKLPTVDTTGFYKRWRRESIRADDTEQYREDGIALVSLATTSPLSIKLRDERPEALAAFQASRECLAKGDAVGRLECLMRSYAIYPGSWPIIVELTGALIEQNEVGRASEILARFEKLHPEHEPRLY